MKSSAVVALVLLTGLGLSGCGSSSDTSSAKDTAKPTSASTTGITPPGVEKNKAPVFKGTPAGIITDTKVTSCSTAKGAVKATGTVTNKAPGPRDIVITMAWATPSTSDVLARDFAVLKQVKAGATMNWSIDTTLDSNEPVACVPTAQRGELKTQG